MPGPPVAPFRSALAWLTLSAVVIGTTWLFWPTPGTSDVELWLGWVDHLTSLGPRQGYVAIHADYPPGASLVLWAITAPPWGEGIDPRILLKIAVFGFLVTTTAIAVLASRSVFTGALAHGALALNALALVYLDILIAPFLFGAVWAAQVGRAPLMMGLLITATFIKWQPIIVLPFALVYLAHQRQETPPRRWRASMTMMIAVVAAIAVTIVAMYGAATIFDSFRQASRHAALSNFAANGPWVLTWIHERVRGTLGNDGIVSILSAKRIEHRIFTLLTLLAYGWTLRVYWQSRSASVASWLRYSLVGYLCYFTLSTGAHENHLFVASLLALALAWQERRWTWIAVVVAISANLNLLMFYGWDGRGAHRWTAAGIDVTVWLAVANCVVFLLVSGYLFRGSRRPDHQLLQDGGWRAG
jgi:hypothetical protein